ncbi:MAG: glycoside hydrolase family 2 protein [Halanaerobiales bacterium]
MLKRVISQGWQIKSSQELDLFGEKISSINYNAEGWQPVTVPGTVVSGLVENGVYPDPYYDKNISKLPGYKHGKDSLFSNHYMPDDSPFRYSWWYRNEFDIPEEWEGKKIWLEFRGINYSANIWVNRNRVAGAGEVQGTYRTYRFDISNKVNLDKKNVVAVEVFAPQPDDLAMTFIDWSPVPPDDSMGIWQPVTIEVSEEISIKNTFVRSKLIRRVNRENNVPANNLNDTGNYEPNNKLNKQQNMLGKDSTDIEAELMISTEIYNDTEKTRIVRLVGEIEDISFEKTVSIDAKTNKEVLITTDDCSELRMKNPRLWWPYQLGEPELYQLNLKAYQESPISKKNVALSDKAKVNFGIREIRSFLNEEGSRVFTINGQWIQLRGAAWAPDLMLRQSEVQDEIDIDYVKNMNFNTIRLEGKLASDYFWELCDREGIIVIAGWPCCNHWEKWEKWKAEDLGVAVESLKSQLKRLRNHPSFTAWFYGSDFPPVYEVEREYLKIMKETHPDIPAISSAADKATELTGEPGVKMSGPYSYVPPEYWYDEDMPGVAGKFNTETGPDMCIPQLDSLKKMLSPEELEVESEGWKLHAGLAAFTDTSVLDRVIKGRFGGDLDGELSLEEYVKSAQLIGYQSWRAMFEAHFRNWPAATGVIGWMLNSSWPSLIWQLYDYYNLPNGAFYGSKKACEPLHLQYAYDDKSIYLANQTFTEQKDLKVRAILFDSSSNEKYRKELTVDGVDKYTVKDLFSLSEELMDADLSFLFLYLESGNQSISKNVYYLPAGKDVYDKKSKAWFHRPLKEFASLQGLREILEAEVQLNYSIDDKGDVLEITAELENQSDKLSCFNQLKVYDKNNQIITPVYWSDNFLTLIPGETERVTGVIKKKQILHECTGLDENSSASKLKNSREEMDRLKVILEGWN